jgi:excisionase family DNA binding protein
MATVPEAAEELRVSANHLYNLCARGELEHRRLGRRVLIPRVVIDALTGAATTSPSHGSAAVVEGDAIGAAGPSPRATEVLRGSGTSTAARAPHGASAGRSKTKETA